MVSETYTRLGAQMAEEKRSIKGQSITQYELDEVNLLPTLIPCGCIGHWFPGVSHMAPCCDKAHITIAEFNQVQTVAHGLVGDLFEQLDLPDEIKPNELLG